MSTLKEWLIDNQENGDDGTGHCDYKEVVCEECGYEHDEENELMTIKEKVK